MKKLFFSLVAACCALPLSALDIEVVDVDLGLPLEGVRVAYAEGTFATDADGKVSMELPPGRRRLTFSLPGYDTTSATAEDGLSTLKVSMRISTVLEGQELVVEKTVPLKSDTQSGVSVAISDREMKSTAQIGIVEDVMSSIKTLPGVGYSGGWNARPSIRGGSPDETTVVLDGFEVAYPYHWGGAFSIFNPNVVESAKLSAGLVSARYGRLISGLLEINSKTPETPELRVDASLTTSGAEAYIQTPIGRNAGLLLGGKVTWMEVSFALAGGEDTFNQVPFIRDGYGRFFWMPADRLQFALNGFIGSDGVGVEMEGEEDVVTTDGVFDWINRTFILSGDVKWLAKDNLQLQAMAGWNRIRAKVDFDSTYSGDVPYSQAFLDKYDGSGLDADGVADGKIAGADSFNVDGAYFRYREEDVNDIFQGRMESEWEFAEGQSLVFGADGLLNWGSVVASADGYQDFRKDGIDYYTPVRLEIDTEGNKTLNTGSFLLWEYGGEDDSFSGEVGLRVDHTYLWNDDISIQTYPVANPRLRLAWRPVRNAGDIKSLTFTTGGGLFSKLPYVASAFDEEYGMDDFSIGPDRAVLGLAGTELQLSGGWKFSLEGYYKYYFQRIYITEIPETNPVELEIHDDGIGYATGFDLMLQRKESRWFDGYITYSFIYARYKNPTAPEGNADTSVMDGSPLDEWYFPSYHRFHNLNLVANFKPWNAVTFSIKASLASGAPRKEIGEPEPYAAIMDDGTVIERWRRSSVYSDSLRNDLSCPVDIKVSFSNYYRKSKVRWEYYIGLENVFANLYSPKTNKAIDEFTGEELSSSGEAEFTAGIPIPSFGFKISY